MTKTSAQRVETIHCGSAFQRATYVAQLCTDAKGYDLSVLDVSRVFDLADYFVIVSARSDRHVQGIVNRLLDSMAEQHIEVLSVDGYETAHWVVIDCGDILINVFYEPVRETYDLESLWLRAEKLEVIQSSNSNRIALTKVPNRLSVPTGAAAYAADRIS